MNSRSKAFALSRRVLVLLSSKGTGIDVSLGALPFVVRVVERTSFFSFDGVELRTCSAEDLVVLKLFASRALDIRDVEGVARNRGKLDWRYIEEQLRPLAEVKQSRRS